MQKSKSAQAIGFTRHNHARCVTDALKLADDYCRQNKLRFTKVRRRALGILLESHAAMGAYELLDRLKAEGLGSKPPVAYRALAFLLDHGFIHRVETLNAFIACSHPGAIHAPAFLICSDCGSVAEQAMSAAAGLSKKAKETGFQIQHTIIEAEGQCPKCQSHGTA